MYAIGDQVEKFTGDYVLVGEVRMIGTTKAGKVRYVVEHPGGFLHIYSEANLRPAPPPVHQVNWQRIASNQATVIASLSKQLKELHDERSRHQDPDPAPAATP